MPPLDDATGISRRRFHKLALAGLGLPAASPAVAAGSQTRRVFDVLVVGGGVSGAYIAWRLMTGDPRPGGPLARLLGGPSRRRPRVGLLEASDRIGGRLYTVTQPEAPHLHAELGGMRFLETHESVGGLARHLGLDIVDFPMGGPSNRQHLRGVNFLRDDYEANPALVPHKLRASERGHQPWRLVVEAFLGAFPALAAMSPDEASEYLKTAEFDGRPLWEVGFWNFLIRQLSPEAFNLVCAASGYHTVVSNWNAYDAIVFIMEDFASPAYHRLAGGYQSLPLSLAQHFVEQGGVVHLDTRATSLVRAGGAIRVSAAAPDRRRETTFIAEHVVLALPRRSLELLDPDSFIFTDQFRADLTTVTPEQGAKVFLWYDQEWWTPLGLSSLPWLFRWSQRCRHDRGSGAAEPNDRPSASWRIAGGA